MEKTITYTKISPSNFEQLLEIYKVLGWDSLNLTVEELEKMCNQSWYAIYAFHKEQLVGMGRIISDGVITGIISGVCVHPDYQAKGIGKEIVNRLVQYCEQNKVIPKLMCKEDLEDYYNNLRFERFSIGMIKKIKR